MSPKRRKSDRPAPHAGSHHRIYSLKELDPSTNADVYSFQWAEGCKLKSLIEIYLKDGNSLNNTLYTKYIEEPGVHSSKWEVTVGKSKSTSKLRQHLGRYYVIHLIIIIID